MRGDYHIVQTPAAAAVPEKNVRYHSIPSLALTLTTAKTKEMGKIKDMQDYLGTNEVRNLAIWKAVAAEFVGTLVLVLVVCGACLQWKDPPTIEQIGLSVGVVVFCLVQALGHVSGGHLNPAVTCAMLVARYVSVIRALLYIIAQCVGGVVAAGILKGLTPADKQGSLGMTVLGEGMTGAQGFGVEFMITFILVLVVFGVCDERRSDVKGLGPLAIGLSITACHMGAIPFTGAAMNPARSFGPAVITGIWADHWVYWAGPIVGGMIASLLYTYVFRAPKAASYDLEMDPYAKQTSQH